MATRPAIVRLSAAHALAGLVSFATLSSGTSARAADTDVATAQVLFDEAKKLMSEGNYVDACPKLQESQRLAPGIGTEFNLADCFEHTDRLASAWAAFLDVAEQTHARGERDREKVARDRAGNIEPKLGRLVVAVPAEHRVDGLEVQRDGVVVRSALWGVDVPVDAGDHTITARAPGRMSWSTRVSSTDGQSSSLEVPALGPVPQTTASTPSMVASSLSPPASASAKSTSGIVPTATATTDTGAPSHLPAYLVGAGGLVLGGLGVLGIVQYNSKVNDYNANGNCPGIGAPNQPSDCSSIVNQANTWRAAGIVSFVAGGLALGAAVVLFVTERPSSPPGSARLGCSAGLGSLVCAGSF
jgi:hypothetical protein